ncbi:MAG: UPF0182 family protein [Candidatus Aenigmarchaeota archaeon]|nr:UPF0182 family protein [Candidatus Aenigmarchaeota archaeon]
MKIGSVVFFVILVFIMSISAVLNIFGDLFWFSGLGYENVFLRVLFTNINLGFMFGLAFLIFAIINVKLAKRFSLSKKEIKGGKVIDYLLVLLTLVFSFVIAFAFSKWEVVLKYLNSTPFGAADPVFGMDMGFYVFSLPFYTYIFGFFLVTLILTIILAFGTHLLYSNSIVRVETEDEIETSFDMGSYTVKWDFLKDKAKSHISFLVGILFFIISYGIYLARYGLLFSESGMVFGAGYTDLNVVLPLMNILIAIAAIVGVLFIINAKVNKWKLGFYGVGLFVGIGVIGLLAFGITQALIVNPDEFNMEKPYIERNIQNTLDAYNLDGIEERMFPISYDLTMEDIEKNKETIGNIRLWDWRPLIQTYDQLQLFRTYYQFNDVDIDRYDINNGYKQVMISAREMDISSLPENAQTWVNSHLVYTHGYGVVMNPVDRVSQEGLPEFYVKDIPPASDYFNIERPEIYYGEGFANYVVVKTTTEELDYPSGEQNIYTSYEGTGGIDISDSFKRLVYAAKFSSIELLVSGSIKTGSRILLYRDISLRVRKIADFLLYDSDPYVVVSDGRLYWIIDAYTTTDMYPYSEPIYHSKYNKVFNYIRNSVKVVIDAYSGDVRFYVIDKEDPVIQTYRNIFPDLFTDFEEMSADLKKHVRYPEDLFRIQAELYSVYHMKNPRVFYNKEDTWVVPNEIYRERRQEMQPYYIITKLSEDEKEEFILMLPFIPKGKENLIAWMAARCDFPNYGKVTVFQFSKQVLTYGPMQIEARIDQDTEISQKITLWSQAGSSVIRGNTLVIPIENSIIYIEPLYLEATEKGTLPQLKRVIVAYGNEISMKETLQEAIEEIFGGVMPVTPITEEKLPEDILNQIASLYTNAQNALKTGDLAGYAQYVDQIGQILEGWKK